MKMIRSKLSDGDIARLNWQLCGTTPEQAADIVQRWADWIEADEIARQAWENESGYLAGAVRLEALLLAAETARQALDLDRVDESLRIERFVNGPDV